MFDIQKEKIDLLLWCPKSDLVNWSSGNIYCLKEDKTSFHQGIKHWVDTTDASFGLFWSSDQKFPKPSTLANLISNGLDIAHAGLAEGFGEIWPDLAMIKQDWSMINAPADFPSTNWRMSMRSCLIKRSLLKDLNYFDTVFSSLDAASLDFGLRALNQGAIIEYRPELNLMASKNSVAEPPISDLYKFVFRHYGLKWAKYLYARRVFSNFRIVSETKALKDAQQKCIGSVRHVEKSIIYQVVKPTKEECKNVKVSVVLPTLGRYEYLKGALDSLRSQSITPYEVIVIDQNPPDERSYDVYTEFQNLNLQVIMQDEQGQSLARNTGLAVAKGDYVFFFDDDSIARPDLIEQHLLPVIEGSVDVSTGVSLLPEFLQYELPSAYRIPRLAQTFDTGNSLLSLDLARKMGGLDRNYDFGPGTDADFGTRLYLAGYRILHNPKAIRIHFKAPSGGLRVHNVHRYNTDLGLLAPYPPVTRAYYGLRFLSHFQQRETIFLSFFLSKFHAKIRRSSIFQMPAIKALFTFLMYLLFFPIKKMLSIRAAKKLFAIGPRLVNF